MTDFIYVVSQEETAADGKREAVRGAGEGIGKNQQLDKAG